MFSEAINVCRNLLLVRGPCVKTIDAETSNLLPITYILGSNCIVFGLMAFAKFTQQRERKRRDLIRVIPRDWGNLGSRRTVWWGWKDSNFQPNDYQLLASEVPEVSRFATSALSPPTPKLIARSRAMHLRKFCRKSSKPLFNSLSVPRLSPVASNALVAMKAIYDEPH